MSSKIDKKNCSDKCPSPDELCCTPKPCKIDPCKNKCICTYIDTLYSEGTAHGSSISTNIGFDPGFVIISAEYFSTDPCCPPCSVGANSVFTVDSASVTVKSLFLINNIPIDREDVLVNGQQVLSVSRTIDGYIATINPSVLNDNCTCKGTGTKGNVLMQDLGLFAILFKITVCGKVTTNGVTCNFKITFDTRPNAPFLIGQIPFSEPEICLPPTTTDPIKLKFNFLANAQFLNPVITAEGGPAPLPVRLNLRGVFIVNPEAKLQIVTKNKVCLTGNVN